MATFQTRLLSTGTAFALDDNGIWLMADTTGDGLLDLIYIKTSNTGTNTVEVHVASGASKYQEFIEHTGTAFALDDNGVWTMADTTGGGRADLVYIKRRNTGTGTVEVHVASAASRYKQRTISTGTTFHEENNGTWLMSKCTLTRTPHLVYIKTRNTGMGRVEVHIASSETSKKW